MGIVVGPTSPPRHTRCSTLHCPTCPTGLRRTIRSPDGSQIVTWTVRRTPLDSTGIKVDSCLERGIQLSPPDCAGLDSSGVKNGSGVQRGVSGGVRRTGPLSRNIQHTYLIYVWWTVLDWTLLESKEVCPVESAGLSCPGLFWSVK